MGKAMNRKIRVLSGVSLLMLAVAGAAQAAEAGPKAGEAQAAGNQTGETAVPDIIVTAQKRSENVQNVPISITAVTGDQLTRAGVTDTSQLTKLVPGFTFQQSSYGTPVYSIRGIGFYDTSVGISPAVSVYVDQVPLP